MIGFSVIAISRVLLLLVVMSDDEVLCEFWFWACLFALRLWRSYTF
jgi:hypothetical protein